jgi:anti-sigma B factor antagonist
MNVTDSFEPGAAETPEPEQFRVVMSAHAHGTLVVPHGELDLAAAPQLEAVLAAQSGAVTVDLRHLSFIDASGLRILLEAEAASRQDGMSLAFVPGEAVRRLLECAGLPDELTYVEAPAA